jgi:DoxX-like family
MVNVVLWIVQIFLGFFFLGAAFPKLTGRGLDRWTGFSNLPRGLVLGIGIGEVLESVGIVLPMATGILPWLTPLAAMGLAINVLMATGFHVREDERLKAMATTLWAAIAGIIAIGRWNLIDQEALAISPRALVAALAVLLPAVIIIVTIIYRHPPPTTERLQRKSSANRA